MIIKHSHTGFEALRILAMLMIVSLHYLGHGGVLQATPYSTNYLLGWFINAFCKVGVNCYVLISGYFLVKSSDFKIKKACDLWIEVFFYSAGIFLLFYSLNIIPLSTKGLLKSFLPIKLEAYWFVTAYMGLYILYPYLNKLITNLSKRDYQKFIFVLLGIFSIYSFVGDTFHVVGGSSLIWFIVLYCIGGYFRLFDDFSNKNKMFLFYVIMSIFIFITKITLYSIGSHFGFATKGGSEIFYAYNSPILLCSSVALFLFFKNVTVDRIWLLHLINFFAPLTFGVYLIHDNDFVRANIWRYWLNTPAFYDSQYFLLHYIMSVISVFVICALIDKIRQSIFFISGNMMHTLYERHRKRMV
ncbi:MAG: acyltransferase [Veillonellales bacterium]